MCGIAGFVYSDFYGAEAESHLKRMLDLIVHRGPDGSGTHVDKGVAMGMRRLSIIDLEGGTQPIWNEDGTVGIVFNGEIYNYLELRNSLSGHRFSTHSDTEVLVHLYEEHGYDMFKYLRGMFAFAIYDRKKNCVLLARDHFGQKPLYYTSRNGIFAFASELKCLLSLKGISPETDPDAFLDYITWYSLPAPRTHFKNIHKLEPGSCMTVPIAQPNDYSFHKYWSYSLSEPADLNNLEEAANQLDGVLEESIRLHLRADVPVGVLLSSGLDSRCVSAYAQKIQQGQLSTFSVGFDHGDSELEGAALTAKEIGSSHHELVISAKDFAADIGRIAWHLDEPIGDAAAYAVLKVCELARGHVKVLLSGEGADELFGGYAERYDGMRQTIERSEQLRMLRGIVPRPSHFPVTRWERFRERAHLSRGEEIVSLRREGLPGDVRFPRGLTQEQLDALRFRNEQLSQQAFKKQKDILSELLCFDIRWQLPESLLMKADKMSMGASIELRTPFLDRVVGEFAARLDSNLKLPKGGPGKLVLRRCLSKRINEPVNRPKKGFPVPLHEWFSGLLKENIRDTVFSTGAECFKYLDRGLVERAWEDFLRGQWQGSRVFYALWLYEMWYKSLRR